MRMFTSFLFLIFTLFTQLPTAYAGDSSLPVRNKFATRNVSTSTYEVLVKSTVKGIKGMSIANSGSAPIEIAYGASGSESVQVIVPASSTLIPVYYPVSGGYGLQVSVISLDQTNSTGELEVNLIYN